MDEVNQEKLSISPPPYEEVDAEAAMVLNESHPGYYQQWMHDENSRRLTKVEEKSDKMLETLLEIKGHTSGLSDLKKDVDELKLAKSKFLGAKEMLVLFGAPALSWATRFIK